MQLTGELKEKVEKTETKEEAFLKAGGSADPATLLSIAGVDPFDDIVKSFRKSKGI